MENVILLLPCVARTRRVRVRPYARTDFFNIKEFDKMFPGTYG